MKRLHVVKPAAVVIKVADGLARIHVWHAQEVVTWLLEGENVPHKHFLLRIMEQPLPSLKLINNQTRVKDRQELC